MIKIYKLNKKYNAGRRNEIHVINDISLEFEKTGLVCLLGPSGSGKTTLLNAIGGLAKVDSGMIDFDGEQISRYRFSKWDRLRRKNIGFIFQNYALLPELTVFENVKFSLQLTDISDEEIEERVEYALAAVKMDKYKRRKARNLSGGQQQRVAIARALVTSPNVIIADEPTGNLDTVNSTQIMNIIKKISKDCLVILVTHNRNLASFYADRIIELKDGKIVKDYKNHSSGNLEFKQDQNIYLQDLYVEKVADEEVNLRYFYEEQKVPVDVKLVFKNNTIYISADSEDFEVKFLSPSDEVKLIDAKRTGITQAEVEDFNYELEKIVPTRKKHRAVISLKSAFKLSFNRLRSLKKFQKLLLSGFVLTAILIVVSTATYLGTKIYNPQERYETHKDLIAIEGYFNSEQVKELIDALYKAKGTNGIVHYATTTSMSSINFIYDIFLQIPSYNRFVPLEGTVIDINTINSNSLFMGRMPQNKYEIVVDKNVVDNIMEYFDFSAMGLVKYEYFIDTTFVVNRHSFELERFDNGEQKTIVGIVETDNAAIYADLDMYYTEMFREIILESDTHRYETTYNKNLKANEILINEMSFDLIGPKQSFFFEDFEFDIVGSFTSDNAQDLLVMNSEAVEKMYLYRTFGRGQSIAIYSQNKQQTMDFLEKQFLNSEDGFTPNNFKYYDMHQHTIDEYRRYNAVMLSTQTIFSIITLGASLLFLYFVIRSSLISRIYEIGVYRSLGVPRRDIYKIFSSEITLITLYTTTVGWAIISYIFLKTKAGLFASRLYYNLPIALVILASLWIINLLIGLLPVFVLLRKAPSEILSKYDI